MRPSYSDTEKARAGDIAMCGSGSSALDHLRMNSFAWPSVKVAKGFLKKSSFSKKAAGSLPEAIKFFAEKCGGSSEEPCQGIASMDGTDIHPITRIVVRAASSDDDGPLEVVGGEDGGDLHALLELSDTPGLERQLNALAVPLMRAIDGGSAFTDTSQLLIFFLDALPKLLVKQIAAKDKYEGAMVEYRERNGPDSEDYKPKQKTLLEERFRADFEARAAHRMCEDAIAELRTHGVLTKVQLVYLLETLKLAIIALVVASTHYLVVFLQTPCGTLLVPIIRAFYSTLTNAVMQKLRVAATKLVSEKSSGRVEAAAFAFDGEHAELREETPQGVAKIAIERTTKIAKSGNDDDDEAAGRPSNQAGKSILYAALCKKLIQNTLAAPPRGPAIPYFSNYKRTPPVSIAQQAAPASVPVEVRRKFLGSFVSIPGQAALGEVASFCHVTQTFLITFGAGVEQRMNEGMVRQYIDSTAGRGAAGSSSSDVDVCSRAVDGLTLSEASRPLELHVDGKAELSDATAAMAASRSAAAEPQPPKGRLHDVVKNINEAFAVPSTSVMELPSDPIAGQPPSAEAEMFLPAILRGRLAFLETERKNAQTFADASAVVAAAKAEQRVGLSKTAVSELSLLCKSFDLSTHGKKPDLVLRLRAHAETTPIDHLLRKMIEIDDALHTVAKKWVHRLSMPTLEHLVANSELNALLSKQVIKQFTFTDSYHLWHNMTTRLLFNTKDEYCVSLRVTLKLITEKIGCSVLRSIVNGAVDKHSHMATHYFLTHPSIPVELRALGRVQEAVLFEVLGEAAQALLRPHRDPEWRIDSLHACLILLYRIFGRAVRDVGFLRRKSSMFGFTVSQLVNLTANIENQIRFMGSLSSEALKKFKETSLTTRAIESSFSRIASNVGSGDKPTQWEIQGLVHHLDGLLVIMRQENKGFTVPESRRKRKMLESDDAGWNNGDVQAAARFQKETLMRAKGYTTGYASTRDHNAHAGGQR